MAIALSLLFDFPSTNRPVNAVPESCQEVELVLRKGAICSEKLGWWFLAPYQALSGGKVMLDSPAKK